MPSILGLNAYHGHRQKAEKLIALALPLFTFIAGTSGVLIPIGSSITISTF
jgi:hypothetical protein